MSELLELLWEAFKGEAHEQLESLEQAMVVDDKTTIDVAHVFRTLHTLKGSCAMMGFASMETLAYAAETMLDPVRNGARTFSDEMVVVLREVVAALKQQMDDVNKTRANPEPQPLLEQRLRKLMEESQ